MDREAPNFEVCRIGSSLMRWKYELCLPTFYVIEDLHDKSLKSMSCLRRNSRMSQTESTLKVTLPPRRQQ